MVIDVVMVVGVKVFVGFVLVGDGCDCVRVVCVVVCNLYIYLLLLIIDWYEFVWLMVSCDVLIYGCEVEVFCIVGGEVCVVGLFFIMFDLGGGVDYV